MHVIAISSWHLAFWTNILFSSSYDFVSAIYFTIIRMHKEMGQPYFYFADCRHPIEEWRWMAKRESFCSRVVGDVVWNSCVSFFFSINCWQKKILVNIEHPCLWAWILVCMYSSLDMGTLFDFHYQAEVIQKTFHLLLLISAHLSLWSVKSVAES